MISYKHQGDLIETLSGNEHIWMLKIDRGYDRKYLQLLGNHEPLVDRRVQEEAQAEESLRLVEVVAAEGNWRRLGKCRTPYRHRWKHLSLHPLRPSGMLLILPTHRSDFGRRNQRRKGSDLKMGVKVSLTAS